METILETTKIGGKIQLAMKYELIPEQNKAIITVRDQTIELALWEFAMLENSAKRVYMLPELEHLEARFCNPAMVRRIMGEDIKP